MPTRDAGGPDPTEHAGLCVFRNPPDQGNAWRATLFRAAAPSGGIRGFRRFRDAPEKTNPMPKLQAVRASKSRLFSYVVRYDTGFAPHVFNGICTLATCKPQIRRAAGLGDWILGTSGLRYCDSSLRVVYLMQVTEDPIPFDLYDSLYPERRPSPQNPLGDNIYFLDPASGQFQQRPNAHHGPKNMPGDLSSTSVLVSRRFLYFGNRIPKLPDDLDVVKKGPGHRCSFEPSVLQRLIEWSNSLVGNDGWNKVYGRSNEDNP